MIVAFSYAESNYRASLPRNIVSSAQLTKVSLNLIFNLNSEGVKQLAALKCKDFMIPVVCDENGKSDCLWECVIES